MGSYQAWVPLRLQGTGADTNTQRREYAVTFIEAGYVMQRNGQPSNWRLPAETLKAAVSLLDGVGSFVDHADWFEMPSLRDLAAVCAEPVWVEKEERIDGLIRLYDRPDLEWLQVLLDAVVLDQGDGAEVPDVGLSLTFFGRHDWIDIGDEPGEEFERVTTEITHVESCDLVFGPGANGRVREALSKVGSVPQQNKGVITPQEEVITMTEQLDQKAPVVEEVPAEGEAVSGAGGTGVVPSAGADLVPRGEVPVEVFQGLSAKVDGIADQLDRLVGVLADQAEGGAVQGMGQPPRDPASRVYGMLSTVDQIEQAYFQLMGLPTDGPVQRLSGIRELYLLLTGDREMRGLIDTELVPSQLAYSSGGANADTTTMAELTRNVMNKALVAQLDLLVEYNWWRQVARVDNFNSLQQVSWVRYGGIGYGSGTGLPSVAEKGEYQQLYWEDERTTADWVKKGGYLPLSLEMIDRDDLAGWRDVPRQLAVAEAVTISSVISALFTDNSGAGADLSDSVGDGYAFNTTRGNLITQPLDQTNWDTAVNTMYERAQLMNASVAESRAIAARPKFVLVPIELESQAIASVASAVKPSTFGDVRPTKRILPEENVITVPHWTNADNWAAVADPALVPFVGVGFRFGEQPEIFTPADTNHILWLHDVLPVKVRWFFAVSVIDTRGAIKSNLG